MNRFSKIIGVIVLIFFVGFFVKLTRSPGLLDINEIVVNILNNPSVCEKSNPDQFLRIKRLNWRDSRMKLILKTNSLPKRVDYYIVDQDGKDVAEVIYRVNAKCDGIYIDFIQ